MYVYVGKNNIFILSIVLGICCSSWKINLMDKRRGWDNCIQNSSYTFLVSDQKHHDEKLPNFFYHLICF